MNDQQIYELMAKKPKISAIQICDALDEDLADVSAALRTLVDCGDVLRMTGTSQIGRPMMVYDLSDTFKASKEHRALMALMAISSVVKVATASMAPPVAPVEPPAETRIEMAVAYLATRIQATEDDLRGAMGLKAGAYPIAYLSRAIKTGLLHKRTDGMWEKGPAPAPLVAALKPKPIAKPRAPLAKPKPGPVAQFSATAQPDDVLAIEAPAPGPVEPPAALRCGLWSDGTVELQRDGRTVAAMAQGDAEFMAAFLARVRA